MLLLMPLVGIVNCVLRRGRSSDIHAWTDAVPAQVILDAESLTVSLK